MKPFNRINLLTLFWLYRTQQHAYSNQNQHRQKTQRWTTLTTIFGQYTLIMPLLQALHKLNPIDNYQVGGMDHETTSVISCFTDNYIKQVHTKYYCEYEQRKRIIQMSIRQIFLSLAVITGLYAGLYWLLQFYISSLNLCLGFGQGLGRMVFRDIYEADIRRWQKFGSSWSISPKKVGIVPNGVLWGVFVEIPSYVISTVGANMISLPICRGVVQQAAEMSEMKIGQEQRDSAAFLALYYLTTSILFYCVCWVLLKLFKAIFMAHEYHLFRKDIRPN